MDHAPAPLIKSALQNRDLILESIEMLHKKLQASRKLFLEEQDEVSFAQLYQKKESFAAALRQAWKNQDYQFLAAEKHVVHDGAKLREVYRLCLSDRVVHRVIADAIYPRIMNACSPRVYSYRKGMNRYRFYQDFRTYLLAHQRDVPDVKQRGLYVIRSDFSKYGESIPTHPHSVLWKQVQALFTPEDLAVLHSVINPVITSADGEFCAVHGVMDGSSVTPLFLNLYAHELDEYLANIEGGFYARYGDDIIFAHPDAAVFLRAEKKMHALCASLHLGLNPKKYRRVFFNRAARPGTKEISGVDTITVLGFDITFKGALSLPQEKNRVILKDIQSRLLQTSRANKPMLRNFPEQERARLFCSLVNHALDPRNPFCVPHMDTLQLVNCKPTLMQLDYLIARMVVRALVHNPNVRGFRSVPYETLRKEYGLISLAYRQRKRLLS